MASPVNPVHQPNLICNVPATQFDISTKEAENTLISIEEEFYSAGWSEFIEAYVAGDIKLPVTGGPIPGLPLAWRRLESAKSVSTHKPSLLFFDLLDSEGSYLNTEFEDKSKEILTQISSQIYSSYPLFGASGLGKTRITMDMLSQNWGFYFNCSRDDYGSDDISALLSFVNDKLDDNMVENSLTARSITACLLLARMSILSRILTVSIGKITPSQWMLLQVCPQVLGECYFNDSSPSKTDLFMVLFERIASLLYKTNFVPLTKILKDRFDILSRVLSEQYRNDSKFLLVLDEVQVMEGALPKGFWSGTEGIDGITQTITLPFLYELEELSSDLSKICMIPCGAGMCAYDLDWIGKCGKAWKSFHQVLNDPTTKSVGIFPRLDGPKKVEAYFEAIFLYLEKQGYKESSSALKNMVNSKVYSMIHAWLRGRLRSMVTLIEQFIQHGDGNHWKTSIAKLVSELTDPNSVKENVFKELDRIINCKQQNNEHMFWEIFSGGVISELLYYRGFKFYSKEPMLVEAFSASIVQTGTRESTHINEPIAYIAAFKYFSRVYYTRRFILGKSIYFVGDLCILSSYFDAVSPAFLIPTFHKKTPESDLFRYKTRSNTTVKALEKKKFSIVGNDSGYQGIKHDFITLDNFLNAHCNNGSIHNDCLLPPFFLADSEKLGPDIVFVLESEGQHYPVFVQAEISGNEKRIIADRSLSYECIESHFSRYSLSDFCSQGVFFSLIFMPYHGRGFYFAPDDQTISLDDGTTLEQFTMIIDYKICVNQFSRSILEDLEYFNESFSYFRYSSIIQAMKNAESGSGKRKTPIKSRSTNKEECSRASKKIKKIDRGTIRRVQVKKLG